MNSAATVSGRGREESPEAAAVAASTFLRPFVAAVIVAGGVVVAAGMVEIGSWEWEALVILGVLAVVAEALNINVYGDTRVSFAFVPIFAALVLFGIAGVAVIAPLAAVAASLNRRRPLYKVAFNAGVLTLSGAAALLVLWSLLEAGVPGGWPEVVLPAALAAAANFAVNSALVAAAVGSSNQSPVVRVWREHFGWLWPHYIILGVLGLAIATAHHIMGVWGMAIFLAPPLMMRISMKQYVDRTTENVLELRRANEDLERANRQTTEAMQELGRAYEGTLRSLAAALDARDAETGGHSERVSDLAMAVAAEVGLDPESDEWRQLERGALLHDVGKIAVPDHILRKAGPLTDDEWRWMRQHPDAGFQILQSVDFLREAAKIVQAHHERFDGKGYPLGLAGTDIPLGARIFAVCDAFDAMTSDRPYRAAMPPEQALAEILRCSGTQFDPDVVRAFLSVYQNRFVDDMRRSPELSESVKRAIFEATGLDMSR